MSTCDELARKILEADDILVFATQEGCGRCKDYLERVNVEDPSQLPDELVEVDVGTCPSTAVLLGIDHTPGVFRVKRGKVVEELREGGQEDAHPG